jgi:3-hydroxybutyryl-CoA dehydrogenase
MGVSTVAVIGSGLMGRGIAYVAAVGGFRTTLHDVSADALERALVQIRRDLDGGIERGKISAPAAAEALERLRPERELDVAAAEADFVVEAVPEDLALKVRTFARLEEPCRDEVVLASNTSALSITDIAAGCRRRERIIGMHFFNPVHRHLGEKYRPAALLERYVREGRLGKKAGRGVFTYDDK